MKKRVKIEGRVLIGLITIALLMLLFLDLSFTGYVVQDIDIKIDGDINGEEISLEGAIEEPEKTNWKGLISPLTNLFKKGKIKLDIKIDRHVKSNVIKLKIKSSENVIAIQEDIPDGCVVESYSIKPEIDVFEFKDNENKWVLADTSNKLKVDLSYVLSKGETEEVESVAEESDLVPLYRLYNSGDKDHFYTLDEGNKDYLVETGDWEYQGITGYVPKTMLEGTLPLYQLYNAKDKDHYVTTTENGMEVLLKGGKWKYTGMVGYIYRDQIEGTFPLYQIYSSKDKDHIYTIDEAEKDRLVLEGWKVLGRTGYVYAEAFGVGEIPEVEGNETADCEVVSGRYFILKGEELGKVEIGRGVHTKLKGEEIETIETVVEVLYVVSPYPPGAIMISECMHLNQSGGYYVLNQSINTTGTCFTINNNSITLDFNGYTITGPDSGTNYGVYVDGYNETTIKNGEIYDFWAGVYLLNNQNNNITNMTVNSNLVHGIYLSSSSNNTIQDNTANSNTVMGILLASSSNNNLVINNTADSNSQMGILLGTSSNNIIQDNTLNSNRFNGIFLTLSSNNNAITNNNIWNCSTGGTSACAYVYESDSNVFDSNKINLGAKYGVWIRSAGAGSHASHNVFKNTNMTNIAGIDVYLDDDGVNSENLNNTFINFNYDDEKVDARSELIRKWS